MGVSLLMAMVLRIAGISITLAGFIHWIYPLFLLKREGIRDDTLSSLESVLVAIGKLERLRVWLKELAELSRRFVLPNGL